MSGRISKALFRYDRDLAHARGARYVCGADEVGAGAWAGPLVVSAVRFDQHRLDPDPKAFERLEHLRESKHFDRKPHSASSAAAGDHGDSGHGVDGGRLRDQIDRDGARPSTMRAFCGALRSVATTDLREPGGLAPVA